MIGFERQSTLVLYMINWECKPILERLLHAGIQPPVDRITDTCKNITLPQTSFAGGNHQLIENRLEPPTNVTDHRVQSNL